MPHRRGSFHEDWNDLLKRFAHKGTPAATEAQIEDAKANGEGDASERPAWDFHEELFERSHH